MINASKHLSKTELVLFLNKCDILAAKLKADTRFNDHVPVYDGANTVDGLDTRVCGTTSFRISSSYLSASLGLLRLTILFFPLQVHHQTFRRS